jgi:hypothetical protein
MRLPLLLHSLSFVLQTSEGCSRFPSGYLVSEISFKGGAAVTSCTSYTVVVDNKWGFECIAMDVPVLMQAS